MNECPQTPEDLKDLIDDYLSEVIDATRLQVLEDRLSRDPEARRYFVLYCRMHTDLHLETRASRAGHRALHAIGGLKPVSAPVEPRKTIRLGGTLRWLTIAAAVMAAVGGWWWLDRDRASQAKASENIAWLVNAQDCQWANNQAPSGDMRAGKVLQLQRGLAEIRFGVGAQVVLEGPAGLELMSNNSARLLHGKLTASVPEAAKGFQILSPHGRVVDLGTEFAMSVGADGGTDVYVFHGKVEAFAGASKAHDATAFNVEARQAVRIDAGGVAFKKTSGEPGLDAKQFVRAIVPSPQIVPRTFTLGFQQPIPGTLTDANGLGIGLTHRLPGTGMKLKTQDSNLLLNDRDGQFSLKTTNSDINTSFRLEWGEYLGVRLADYGFTGKEDFAVTVVVPNIPELPHVGQFGLYAGVDSKNNIRGGMISTKQPGQYSQFLVKNHGGKDSAPLKVGVGFPGDDFRLTLRRADGTYSLTVENLTTGSQTSVAMPEPKFLAGERDFYVGFFGANTQSDQRRTLMLKEFRVTVWTVTAHAS